MQQHETNRVAALIPASPHTGTSTPHVTQERASDDVVAAHAVAGAVDNEQLATRHTSHVTRHA